MSNNFYVASSQNNSESVQSPSPVNGNSVWSVDDTTASLIDTLTVSVSVNGTQASVNSNVEHVDASTRLDSSGLQLSPCESDLTNTNFDSIDTSTSGVNASSPNNDTSEIQNITESVSDDLPATVSVSDDLLHSVRQPIYVDVSDNLASFVSASDTLADFFSTTDTAPANLDISDTLAFTSVTSPSANSPRDNPSRGISLNVDSPIVNSPDATSPTINSPSVISPTVNLNRAVSPSVISSSENSPCASSPTVNSPSAISPSVSSSSVVSPSVTHRGVLSPSHSSITSSRGSSCVSVTSRGSSCVSVSSQDLSSSHEPSPPPRTRRSAKKNKIKQINNADHPTSPVNNIQVNTSDNPTGPVSNTDLKSPRFEELTTPLADTHVSNYISNSDEQPVSLTSPSERTSSFEEVSVAPPAKSLAAEDPHVSASPTPNDGVPVIREYNVKDPVLSPSDSNYVNTEDGLILLEDEQEMEARKQELDKLRAQFFGHKPSQGQAVSASDTDSKGGADTVSFSTPLTVSASDSEYKGGVGSEYPPAMPPSSTSPHCDHHSTIPESSLWSSSQITIGEEPATVTPRAHPQSPHSRVLLDLDDHQYVPHLPGSNSLITGDEYTGGKDTIITSSDSTTDYNVNHITDPFVARESNQIAEHPFTFTANEITKDPFGSTASHDFTEDPFVSTVNVSTDDTLSTTPWNNNNIDHNTTNNSPVSNPILGFFSDIAPDNKFAKMTTGSTLIDLDTSDKGGIYKQSSNHSNLDALLEPNMDPFTSTGSGMSSSDPFAGLDPFGDDPFAPSKDSDPFEDGSVPPPLPTSPPPPSPGGSHLVVTLASPGSAGTGGGTPSQAESRGDGDTGTIRVVRSGVGGGVEAGSHADNTHVPGGTRPTGTVVTLRQSSIDTDDMDPKTGLKKTRTSDPVARAIEFAAQTEKKVTFKRKGDLDENAVLTGTMTSAEEIMKEREELMNANRVKKPSVTSWVEEDGEEGMNGGSKTESEIQYEARKRRLQFDDMQKEKEKSWNSLYDPEEIKVDRQQQQQQQHHQQQQAAPQQKTFSTPVKVAKQQRSSPPQQDVPVVKVKLTTGGQ